jgi:hypothetical protein
LDDKLRRALALVLIAVVALALTLLLSRGDLARAMIQASPVQSPIERPTPIPTPTVFETPPRGPATPAGLIPTMAPPTSVPMPAPAGPTPTVRGFLPAPTIVNPDEIKSLPLAQPHVSGAGEDDEPTPAPAPTPAGNTMARAAVTLLNYLWLLCGSLLLIGGAGAIYYLWRRDRRL